MKRSQIIGEILAAWEEAANTAAIDCHRNAEDDADRLLRYGIELPANTPDEERAAVLRDAWQAVENGRELAQAWAVVRAGLRRFLRVLKVDTYAQRRAKEENEPAKPWQLRHEHDATMRAANVVPHIVERTPIKLPPVDDIIANAKACGIEVIE